MSNREISYVEQYIWLWLYFFLALFIGYCGYNVGYSHAQTEYAKPVKFKCFEGTVYRDGLGYWEKTGAQCLEKIV